MPRRPSLDDRQVAAGLSSQIGKYPGAGINGWLEVGAARIEDLSRQLDNAIRANDVLIRKVKDLSNGKS